MLLDLAGSIMSGVLSGGATGLLGVALQQWGEARKRAADLEVLRLQHAQALDLRRLDIEQQLKLATVEAASAERLAELQAQARAAESASEDYRASLNADRATYLDASAQRQSRVARWLMALVDTLRGLIRPGATIYSLVLLTMLMLWVRELWTRAGQPMAAADVQQLTLEVVRTVTYLAVTCTVWWFGVRPAARR